MSHTIPSPPEIPATSERIRLERLRHIFFLLLVSAVVATTLLAGCATAPTASAPQISRLPGGIQRLTYPAYHFSVNCPPANYRSVPVAELPDGALAGWSDPDTGSTILVGLAPLPEQAEAMSFASDFEEFSQQDSSDKSTVTFAERKAVSFNGHRSYQFVFNTTDSPMEGVQVNGKLLVLAFEAKKLDYLLMLWAPLGAYEQGQLTLGMMARSFTRGPTLLTSAATADLIESLRRERIEQLYYEDYPPNVEELMARDGIVPDLVRAYDRGGDDLYRFNLIVILNHLAVLGDPNVEAISPCLERAVKDSFPWVRTEAVWGLGLFGTPSSIPLLIPLLDDPDADVVNETILTLAKLTGGEDLPVSNQGLSEEERREGVKYWKDWWTKADRKMST